MLLKGIRYLARRGGISGLNPKDEVECDMIAEACKDLISVVANAPFRLNHFVHWSMPTFSFILKANTFISKLLNIAKL